MTTGLECGCPEGSGGTRAWLGGCVVHAAGVLLLLEARFLLDMGI
jgi:hypothetical protein